MEEKNPVVLTLQGAAILTADLFRWISQTADNFSDTGRLEVYEKYDLNQCIYFMNNRCRQPTKTSLCHKHLSIVKNFLKEDKNYSKEEEVERFELFSKEISVERY